jgi:hypothetical protein
VKADIDIRVWETYGVGLFQKLGFALFVCIEGGLENHFFIAQIPHVILIFL